MKIRPTLLFIAALASLSPVALMAQTAPQTKPTPKPTSVRKPDVNALPDASAAKPELIAPELIAQGKSLYRLSKFKQALAKFEAALKLSPDSDEALGFAAVTAFRLDNQTQSRDYFIRRAELAHQKDSVKAYCYYRAALTYWREAHDAVAQSGEIVDGKLVFKIPQRAASDLSYDVTNGLDYADRALRISSNFSEADNIKNLLHAEAALAEPDEEKANAHRDQSIEALRKALDLSELTAASTRGEGADFSQPTIRIGEFAATKELEGKFDDPMMKMIEGGRPLKRVRPSFPSVRQSKPTTDSTDPSAKGVAADGGAYSIGAGRGALTAAYTSGSVKVEVLISLAGDVVFAHVVKGRSDLSGAAILAARSWKFEPARFEGRPVQMSGVITFEMKAR